MIKISIFSLSFFFFFYIPLPAIRPESSLPLSDSISRLHSVYSTLYTGAHIKDNLNNFACPSDKVIPFFGD